MTSPASHTVPGDWFAGSLPRSFSFGSSVYIDTMYSFDAFLSCANQAFVAGDGAAVHDTSVLISGPAGRVAIGEFGLVNGATIIANDHVGIGANALLAWGAVITDSAFGVGASVEERRTALRRSLDNPDRPLPTTGTPQPVVLEDTVWIGFGAVVHPGVRVGRGAVIGARAVVRDDVPPYSVVVGDPARVVARLDPEARP